MVPAEVLRPIGSRAQPEEKDGTRELGRGWLPGIPAAPGRRAAAKGSTGADSIPGSGGTVARSADHRSRSRHVDDDREQPRTARPAHRGARLAGKPPARSRGRGHFRARRGWRGYAPAARVPAATEHGWSTAGKAATRTNGARQARPTRRNGPRARRAPTLQAPVSGAQASPALRAMASFFASTRSVAASTISSSTTIAPTPCWTSACA
jgi:hypothetical protein